MTARAENDAHLPPVPPAIRPSPTSSCQGQEKGAFVFGDINAPALDALEMPRAMEQIDQRRTNLEQGMKSGIFVVGARGIPDVEGGAEKNAERLFPLLANRGWAVTLVGIRANLKGHDYRGVKLVGVPRSRMLRTDKILYYIMAPFMALKRRPALVHMQGLGSAIMLWAYKLMGAKTVVRYGSADYLLPKWGFVGRSGFLLSEFQLRFADAVIAVTPALAERLAQRGISGNVHVIANATDDASDFASDAELPVPARSYFLAVGRVTEQKNVHRLIEGFNRIKDAHPGITLVIAGGVDDPSYMEQVNPHLNDRIQLLGRLPRSSLGPLYANAIAYVNSSIHEGSSNAVLEAVSWRAPLLLSDIPENRDFGIADRHYFDPESPAAIAAALTRLLADRDAYITDSQQFLTWDEVADRTSAIYEMLGIKRREQAGLPIAEVKDTRLASDPH